MLKFLQIEVDRVRDQAWSISQIDIQMPHEELVTQNSVKSMNQLTPSDINMPIIGLLEFGGK